ncbi:MAG TPA: hypothetical protein VL225_11285 [Vicinamibacterales bacterium]|jgi:hypothetical protein|nr:hypothetical protein [Vicinamibacterales bacterium]
MRTSGSGGRDGLMTAVPLIMLVLFVVMMTGGTSSTLGWVEDFLRGCVEGLARLLS